VVVLGFSTSHCLHWQRNHHPPSYLLTVTGTLPGRFSWPKPSSERQKLALAPEALALLIGGIELRHGSLKAWYER
jgi:hypothetical protein